MGRLKPKLPSSSTIVATQFGRYRRTSPGGPDSTSLAPVWRPRRGSPLVAGVLSGLPTATVLRLPASSTLAAFEVAPVLLHVLMSVFLRRRPDSLPGLVLFLRPSPPRPCLNRAMAFRTCLASLSGSFRSSGKANVFLGNRFFWAVFRPCSAFLHPLPMGAVALGLSGLLDILAGCLLLLDGSHGAGLLCGFVRSSWRWRCPLGGRAKPADGLMLEIRSIG